MPKLPQEPVWQFHVADGESHLADSGASYFDARARQLVDAIGCTLVAIKNVKLERSRDKVWTVTGTVVLYK